MAATDRLFAPPAVDAARVEARQAALPSRLQALLQRAGDGLAGANPMAVQPLLAEALAAAPNQPDVLRLYALLLARMGNSEAAMANFEAALRAAPDDAMGYWQYARVREDAGHIDAALELRQRAVAALPKSPLAWADLGEHIYTYQSVEASLPALERAVDLAPDFAPALVKLGSAYVACGRAVEGAAMIRRALATEPAFGAAWIELVDIKTVPVTRTEVDQMRDLLASGGRLDPAEATAVEYALGTACERLGDYPTAFEHLVRANALRKRELKPWSADDFRAREGKATEVFAGVHAVAPDPRLGEGAIFIAGMPRSGTTLIEQIFAAHPEVHGGGELPALPQVLTEESTRRQQRYPDWVPAASPDDWQRLGQRYLELTDGLRTGAHWSTDKLPTNWRALGAIRAMLPGARIILCRRDPLENCWSCFKQYFPEGWAFTCDIANLATFWKGFDAAATYWAAHAPRQVRAQGYEALTEAPEAGIRALLDFCGLPWNDACLRFHETRRGVQTLSAAQVRQPMYRHRSVAAAYGSLLDPLRTALGLPPTTPAARPTG